MNPAFAICLVFIGCCSNVVFLELLIKAHPGSGNIITCSQFLFIAIEGFIFETRFGTKRPNIPIWKYVTMDIMFFTTSVVNNYALSFHISMPLQMIFRAGSLMSNMVLGIIFLKKSYSLTKYLSVVMISLGIFTCTAITAQNLDTGVDKNGNSNFFWWLLGISLLLFGLGLSSLMGIYQEVLYKEYGKFPREALFYTHVLPLPGFLLLEEGILNHITLFNQSAPVSLPAPRFLPPLEVPILWLFLLANVLTQYACIRGVFVLTTECSSLTVTLVVTLRKFLSIIFSIFYFDNHFTSYHWLGTALVFGGTLLFFDEVVNTLKKPFFGGKGSKHDKLK